MLSLKAGDVLVLPAGTLPPMPADPPTISSCWCSISRVWLACTCRSSWSLAAAARSWALLRGALPWARGLGGGAAGLICPKGSHALTRRLEARFEAVSTASAKFDLSLSLAERRGADGSPAGIEGALEYAGDLFDRASVEAIAGRLAHHLRGLGVRPARHSGR
jgi:hypothetical protein